MTIRYLTHDDGPNGTKHQGWWHPLATMATHYAIVFAVTFGAHDLLVHFYGPTTETTTTSVCGGGDTEQRRNWTALFLTLYCIWFLPWRLIHHEFPVYRHTVLYEYCWLCNVTLVLSAAGLAWQRPMIAGAYAITVGMDQLMWYVDLAMWFTTGHFPIGVTRYLFWKGTTWATRATCTHHLWTLPLVLYATQGMHVLCFPLSVVLMVTNILLSRWMIPLHCTSDEAENPKYLNVNLSHELWKDIKLGFLQINYDSPPAATYLFRLLWRMQAGNTLTFVILYSAGMSIFGPAPIC